MYTAKSADVLMSNWNSQTQKQNSNTEIEESVLRQCGPIDQDLNVLLFMLSTEYKKYRQIYFTPKVNAISVSILDCLGFV